MSQVISHFVYGLFNILNTNIFKIKNKLDDLNITINFHTIKIIYSEVFNISVVLINSGATDYL